MSTEGGGDPFERSLSRLARVIEACDRFEAEWKAGRRPRLEDYVDEAPARERPVTLRRLLLLELSLRRQAGEAPGPAEYHARFPGMEREVDAAFAEPTERPSPPPGPARPSGARPGRGGGRGVLIGLLALQNGFVDRTALLAAIRAWAEDGSRGVDEILIESGHLDAGRIGLLAGLLGEDAPEDDSWESTETYPPAGGAAGDPGGGPAGTSERYVKKDFHSKGSLGEVYRATDVELGREVALKEIQARVARFPDGVDQFVLEAIVTGCLEHPGVVPVYGLGYHPDGRPFYAMRFIRGLSLRERIQQLHGQPGAPPLEPGEGAPTLPGLLRHLVNACYAIAYAHSRRVLNRDIKPAHIMLGPYGETIVVDWGLAMIFNRKGDAEAAPEGTVPLDEALRSGASREGGLAGTIPYMSPEQARGSHEGLGPTTDVYSLGATLYQLLTGHRAFEGPSAEVLLERVRAGDFPRPRQVKADVPRALEAICLKAMNLRPEERYPSARAMAHDLERWLDDEPVDAYPEGPAARAARWLRRHRTAASTAAAVLVSTALVATLAAVLLGQANVRIRSEKRRADLARADAEKARGLAEANFRTTLDVVDEMLFRIADRSLPRVPGLEGLRQDVAERASRHLDELWRQRPDDPEVVIRTAQGFRELANIRRLLGDPQAEAAYGRAIGLLRGTGDRGVDPEHRDFLAEVLIDAAEERRVRGRPAEAETLYLEALTIADEQLKEQPQNPAFLRTRARVGYNLVDHLLSIGRPDEAMKYGREAAEVFKPLADGEKPGLTDRLETALLLLSLGTAERDAGRAEASRATFDDVIRRAEALLAETPAGVDARNIRAFARLERARSGMDDRGAAATLAEAIREFEALSEGAPETPQYRQSLAESLLERAVRRGPEDRPAAVADLERARGLLSELLGREPRHPLYSGTLGIVVGRLGRMALERKAVDEARKLLTEAEGLQRIALEANPNSPRDRQAAAEHRTALEQLRQATPMPESTQP